MIFIGIRLFQKPKPNMIRHINSKDASFGKITVSSINNDKIRRSHNRSQAISHLDFAIISGKRDMAEQRRLVRSGVVLNRPVLISPDMTDLAGNATASPVSYLRGYREGGRQHYHQKSIL